MSELSVTAAMQQRISTRGFLKDKAVPLEVVKELLEVAVRAPSGGNTQPWHLHVVSGEARDKLSAAALKAVQSGTKFEQEYAVYPSKDLAPASYLDRRRKVAYAMYELQGVGQKDSLAKMQAMARNWEFFDAPVAIIVTVDRAVDKNGWGHVGALLQSICLLAEERGLATCLQEAWGNLGNTVYDQLGIPAETEAVWCAIALGYPDKAVPVNTLRTDREPLDVCANFHGFSAQSKL
eukprot:gene22406-11336_t